MVQGPPDVSCRCKFKTPPPLSDQKETIAGRWQPVYFALPKSSSKISNALTNVSSAHVTIWIIWILILLGVHIYILIQHIKRSESLIFKRPRIDTIISLKRNYVLFEKCIIIAPICVLAIYDQLKRALQNVKFSINYTYIQLNQISCIHRLLKFTSKLYKMCTKENIRKTLKI